jgi:hypothetical protein
MRLGVPFIAPRQLGAVESILGRQFLPSVAWRTGQSGAPLDTVRCGFLSFCDVADRWRLGAVGAPDTVRCTPDSPVPPPDRWLGHVSRAYRAADRWPGRQVHLSQPGTPDTVRCTTGQSGAPRQRWLWLKQSYLSPICFLLFLALRHNTLVLKTMY